MAIPHLGCKFAVLANRQEAERGNLQPQTPPSDK